ncbi:putative vacuolar protein sorting 45A [Paratrimastix pyriformis]|uniref:Vacuolar protein sorting 45A n=1 Tax=Paratrimastix pyriformis TaxID=342808 RepID=A0ABQ8UT32_9EUKA|nr:putative vacuolar protein sorting 45A [Paratrimastix pyriformis]
MQAKLFESVVNFLRQAQVAPEKAESIEAAATLLEQSLDIHPTSEQDRFKMLVTLFTIGEQVAREVQTGEKKAKFEQYHQQLETMGFYRRVQDNEIARAEQLGKAIFKFNENYHIAAAKALQASPPASATVPAPAPVDVAAAPAAPPASLTDEDKKRAEDLKTAGNKLFAAQLFDEALTCYNEAIRIREDAIYLANRGATYLSKANYTRALQDLDRSLELNPNYAKAHSRKGLCHLEMGQYPEAIRAFERAVALDPENSSFRENLADARRRAGSAAGAAVSGSASASASAGASAGASSGPSTQTGASAPSFPNLGGMDFGAMLNNPMVANMIGSMANSFFGSMGSAQGSHPPADEHEVTNDEETPEDGEAGTEEGARPATGELEQHLTEMFSSMGVNREQIHGIFEDVRNSADLEALAHDPAVAGMMSGGQFSMEGFQRLSQNPAFQRGALSFSSALLGELRPSPGPMDLIAFSRNILSNLFERDSRMKALITDDATKSMINAIFTHSELVQKNVFLLENIEIQARSTMPPCVLHAIVFVRPTRQNIDLLCREIRCPKFARYHLIFTNALDERSDTRPNLNNIAEADAFEVVATVQECFLDVIPHECHIFTVADTANTAPANKPAPALPAESLQRDFPPPGGAGRAPSAVTLMMERTSWDTATQDLVIAIRNSVRHRRWLVVALPSLHCAVLGCGGSLLWVVTSPRLVSFFLSLHKMPHIRYASNSPAASFLASRVHDYFQRLPADERTRLLPFDESRPSTPPVLLILDRREDPITPLLKQGLWTYEAMIQQVVGIRNGRIPLAGLAVPAHMQEGELQLSPSLDPDFFGQLRYEDYGLFTTHVGELVAAVGERMERRKQCTTMVQLNQFVSELPRLQELSSLASKHVALSSAISGAVERERLFELSEVEQELACQQDHAEAKKLVERAIRDEGFSLEARLNLVTLYALRYQTQDSGMTQTASVRHDPPRLPVSPSLPASGGTFDPMPHVGAR